VVQNDVLPPKKERRLITQLAGWAMCVALLAAAVPAAAQGPPYGPQDVIPAAERKQLAVLLDTVRNAERVEAMPVEIVGEGLSSTSRVVDKPVAVNAVTGRALGRILTRYDWTSWSPSACMFDPALAFRFTRGRTSTVVEVCFMCGEMALRDVRGRFAEKKMLSFAGRNAFLRAAKKAFPKKFDMFEEENPDVKSLGK
jgi:hypothetical protein